MSSYRIDYRKSPKENVVGIINAKNNKKYPVERMAFYDAVDDFSQPGADTKIKIDLLGNGTDTPDEYVEFCYARIQLRDVFKNVDLERLDKVLPSRVIVNGNVVIQEFIEEVERRFGFYLDEKGYDFVFIDNVVTVHAKSSNPLFKGYFDINVEGTRVIDDEKAIKMVEDFSDYLLKIEVHPNGLVERDFEGAIKARYFISNVDNTSSIEGAMVFKNGDKLEFVSDKRAIRQAFKANKLTESSVAPENPIEHDLWIEVE